MIIYDKHGIKLKSGDLIDIYRTINGQNQFVVFLDPLDIRYAHNINIEYEYDQAALLAPDKGTSNTSFEIIHNIMYRLTQLHS